MSTPWVHPFDRAPNMNGIKVIKSDDLPANTMIVSADIYEALAATPEEQAAKTEKGQAIVEHLAAQLKAAGLSPTGREPSEPNYQELPRAPK